MTTLEEQDENSRRDFLVRLLAAGIDTGVGSSLILPTSVWAEKLGQLPGKLKEGRSIYL